MSLQKRLMDQLKIAMKKRDTVALEALRAVKSAVLLYLTETGAKKHLTEEAELKILHKLVKQRKESAILFSEQGREDLATIELAQAETIAQFLPEQISEEVLKKVIETEIVKLGAKDMKDMGKIMGVVSKKLFGKADGKTISEIVKKILSKK